jgi:transposase
MPPTYSLATRAQAVTLRIEGYSYKDIKTITGISEDRVRDLLSEAKRRGYNPAVSKILLDEYLIDKRRGRPPRPPKEQRDGLQAQNPIDAQRASAGSRRTVKMEPDEGCSA